MKTKMAIQKMFLAGAMLNAACAPKAMQSADSTSTAAAPVHQLLDVSPATAAQCANGGMVYTIYLDQNGNSKLDSTDRTVSTQCLREHLTRSKL